ncbi:hypothetical protein EKO23_11315 [Nocardioides guangzhouensis]|uniref:YCII-related domain-containing protein n=1 Tax=Nocardioides guangzhouensis TaxID=2497878 RepID=A0A4Q4ZDR8_9ACTN|nr:YciI family protein [Nocardioides guangzhouensis]RYP85888.1 hypothetical protein EKO23_11315 [Nocardioides guangzhouensis]
MQFQRLSVVRLMTPDPRPPDGPDDDRIQAEHLAYLASLRDRGLIALNGPVRGGDTPGLRGLTVYTVDADEARALATADPAVRAGWFEVTVDTWWVPSVPVTLGDRADIDVG